MKYLYDDDIIVLSKPLAKAVGIGESIILRRLNFWIDFNRQAEKFSTHFRDGKWWMYNTYSEWSKDLEIMSDETCSRHLTDLEKLGLISGTSEYNPHPMMKTKWYTVEYNALDHFMAVWEQCGCPAANGYKSQEYKNFLSKWEEFRTNLPTGQINQSSGQIDRMDGSNQPDPSGQIDLSNNSIEPVETSESFIAAGAGNGGEPSAHTGKEEDEAERRARILRDRNASAEPAFPVPGNDLEQHELTKLFVKMFAPTTLTKAMRNVLTLPVEITPVEEGQRSVKYNSLKWHWDYAPGFQDFVKERFGQFKNYNGPKPDREIILKNLAKFDVRPEPGSKSWPGWLAWKEAHPELCTVIDAAEESSESPVYIYEG